MPYCLFGSYYDDQACVWASEHVLYNHPLYRTVYGATVRQDRLILRANTSHIRMHEQTRSYTTVAAATITILGRYLRSLMWQQFEIN